jgi:hypothetical protein
MAPMGRFCSTGMLSDMKSAIDGVVRISGEYRMGDDSHLDAVIEACGQCMGVVSNLWLELSERVHSKFLKRKSNTKSFPRPLDFSSIFRVCIVWFRLLSRSL